MSKVQRTSGKIVGFLPSSIEQIPTLKAVRKLYKGTAFSAIIKPGIGMPHRFKLRRSDVVHLASVQQETGISIKVGDSINAEYIVKENAPIITKILAINGRALPKVQATSSSSAETLKKVHAESKSASSSASQVSSSSQMKSVKNKSASPSSADSESSAGPASSDSGAESLSSVQYQHLMKSAESPEEIQKEYDALANKPESAVEPGLKKIFNAEGWKPFAVRLGKHAGQSFDKAIKSSPTKTEICMALENENIPSKTHRTAHKRRKPKQHLHDKQVF